MKRDTNGAGLKIGRWMIGALAALVSVTALFVSVTTQAQIDYSGPVAGWASWGNTAAGGHAMLGTKQGDTLIAYSLGQ